MLKSLFHAKMTKMRKLILSLIIFSLGFLTCYTLIVDSKWYSFFLGSPKALSSNAKCATAIEQIEKYDWDAKIATAVMKAESKCDPKARGDTDLVYQENGREYGYSVGVFQIRILPGREDCDTYDLETNVRCAHDIYVAAGGKFTDWTMFLNGHYREYLDS